MKGSAPLLALGVMACVGAAWSFVYALIPLWLLLGFVSTAVVAWYLRGKMAYIMACLATLWAFAFYAQVRLHSFPTEHLFRCETAPRMARFQLQVLSEGVRTVNAAGVERLVFMAAVLANLDGENPQPVTGKLRVWVGNPRSLEVAYGDRLVAAGYLRPIAAPENPGEFDAQQYYRIHGVFHEFMADPALTVIQSRGWNYSWHALALQLRQHMRKTLALGLQDTPETTALLSGMLFGDKSSLPMAWQEYFRRTGTQHLFAVSGFHVATVLAVLLVALDLSGLLRWRWAWLLLPGLALFCLATGLRPSAFRALIMIGLVLLSWTLLRPVHTANLLGAAALVLLVIDPAVVLDSGFQLSFCVVGGIACCSGRCYRLLYACGQPDPWIPRRLLPGWRVTVDRLFRPVCALAATALAAWLASAPILWRDFHIFSPVTPLANICLVPLAGLAVTVATLSVVSGFIWSGLAVCLNQVNWLLAKVMVLVVSCLAQLPGAYWYVGHSQLPEATARFTVFRQEQLSPVLLQYAGDCWLLGCGTVATWRYNMDPYRRSLGINSLDGVILPRSGVQSMGAAWLIRRDLRVAFWAENGLIGRSTLQRQWLQELAESHQGKRFWRRGDRLQLADGLQVRVLWPDARLAKGNQLDDGLVLHLSLPGGSLLFAGNISAEVEQQLLMLGENLRADCLLQGQHPAQNLSRQWLQAVRPKYLIRPPRGYGTDVSLTREFWRTVRECGIEVWDMEECGALVLEIGPKGCRLQSFREKTANE